VRERRRMLKVAHLEREGLELIALFKCITNDTS